MSDPVRVAVIGLGSMGANHARVFLELPDAKLVAVCDTAGARASAASGGGARVYDDFRRLLESEQVDAVSIAVPTRKHVEVALAVIDRGLPSLVEKPLGADLEECLRLKDAAESAGVPLMVGHIERFNPVVQELKKQLLDHDAETASVTRMGPFHARERDVGVVHDLATHDIDVLRWLFHAEVESVSAETQSGMRTPYEDSLTAWLTFDNGLTAELQVNWFSSIKVRTLVVRCRSGLFSADYIQQTLTFTPELGGSSQDKRSHSRELPGAGEAPLRNELYAFLRVARREIEPPVTADDAIAAMRVVEALVESGRSGEAVRLAAARPTT